MLIQTPEPDTCVCDLFPKPQGVVYFCCSATNCKYRQPKEFDGDFIKYFHGTTNT